MQKKPLRTKSRRIEMQQLRKRKERHEEKVNLHERERRASAADGPISLSEGRASAGHGG